ncbi:uncharacterized protein LOC113647761 isoform X1 [Tachysurus fulvidraco]|uniref:uncharacterized protein LOC113647761 isoform X1 n=1 Tax=Tachysurus fulvidraco TaxID=1234273 RepID=UPI001FEE7E30|nr:uncharacterized protein LOC113647761 isoform X1 [Tachysurus fulvidraco]
MTQFETLLLRQLQKQQNRDEFCDTVLQTQGVSVPVHSCVLSAFSSRFYGTLSSMPVPTAGQRRLIELQAVDACTLLSLVSLLYSGQLHENREQVLSAAQMLGIELPQWEEEEERYGAKVGRRKEREDDDQGIEKEVDAREWGDRMTRRMEEGSAREKEKIRESGTQTKCGRETDERGAQTDERAAQTDLACSESESIQTVYLIDPSTNPTNQETGSCMDIQNTALALQAIHPERKSITSDVLALAPPTGDSHPVSESACVSQIFLYSLETSQHQTSNSVIFHPHNSFLDQSLVVPADGANAINDLKQFEGNIPGFINYFLDSTNSQNVVRQGQGCVREGARGVQVVNRARAKSRGTAGGSVIDWVRWTGGGRRQRHVERWGLVARLAQQGQGGGRVGRLLETRSTRKRRMRAFQRRQGREALMEAGEAKGRLRQRQRGKAVTFTGSEEQNDPARKRRPRGRPRVRPLPPISRSLTTMTTTKEANQTVDPTELDLLHSVTPVPAARMETVQPIDTLLDDIMTGLNFLPPSETQTNQHGLMSTTTSSGPPISKATYPSSHLAKPTDAKQHLEGEFGDILDHFLSTFDQHVGCCGIDGGDETLQDKFNAGTDKSDTSIDPLSNTSKTFTQIQPHNPQKSHHQKTQANLLHTSRTLSMETNNDQDGKIRRSKVKKPSRDQKILHQFENQRLTRSQSMKRKLETALISLQNPVKRKCKEKESAEMKKRQRNDHEQSKACVNRKGVKNNKNKAKQVCKEKSQKQRRPREKRQENRFCRNQRSVEKKSHRIDGFNKREKTHQKGRPGINSHCEKKKSRQDHVEAEGKTNGFQAGQSSVKSQIEGTCFKRASYAVEKVRKLLQLQDKEEDAGANKSVEIHQENNRGDESLVLHRCISGAEERLIVENRLQGHLDEIQETEDEGRIMVMGEFGGQKRMNSIVELRQKLGNKRRMADGLRNEEKMSEENSTPFQLHLPSCTAKEKNKEDTISTTESVTNVVGSWPGDPVSALGSHLYQSEVVPLSTQSTMHRMEDLTLNVGDAPRLMSAARLSHTQPCQELLSPHKSMKDSQQLAGSPVDEEDDVDVMEVSNTNSELPAVSIVVLEVDSSTGEEEVEEDFEIDVLGLEPD